MKMYQKRSLALRLSHQLRSFGMTFSLAQKMSWDWINQHGAAGVTFQKLSGEITTRVIARGKASDYVEFKGTGSSIGPDRLLMVDLGKYLTGRPAIISTYRNRIINIVA